ncbi:MAG: PIG-L family deacetylase [Burkholderiales bacterium]|nr:PIG-L family deacetylase [Burkholderiales bacterium]
MLQHFVQLAQAYRALLENAIQQPPVMPGDLYPAEADPPQADAQVCLVFSPHPDDEALVGGLPLRLRAAGWRVVNVAITLGSRLDRRAARWQELQASCRVLGFELVAASSAPGTGLEGIRTAAHAAQHPDWRAAVQRVINVMALYQPRVVVCPHELDGHDVHMATSLLVLQALAGTPALAPHLLLSEYWNTQLAPQLMLGLTDQQVGQLMLATAMHAGEVSRQPYHLTLPAWLMDSARRGAERVGGPGAANSGMTYAALYGWRRRVGAEWVAIAPRMVSAAEDVGALFGA